MNIDNTSDFEEQSFFSVYDVIVPYNEIALSHANENQAPFSVILKKIVTIVLIIAMIAGLIYL